jgi:hypothetical protein
MRPPPSLLPTDACLRSHHALLREEQPTGIDLDEVRRLEPGYSGMPDSMLADTLYTTYFSDLPRTTFDRLLVSRLEQ